MHHHSAFVYYKYVKDDHVLNVTASETKKKQKISISSSNGKNINQPTLTQTGFVRKLTDIVDDAEKQEPPPALLGQNSQAAEFC